jgi:hypothetical protein
MFFSKMKPKVNLIDMQQQHFNFLLHTTYTYTVVHAQCQIELLFFPLHYFHSFRDGLGVKKSNFFFYK